MKTKFFLPLFVTMVMMAMSTMKMWAGGTQPSLGNGTADNPYLIGSVDELVWFRDQVNTSFSSNLCAQLTNDIDLSTVCHAASGEDFEVCWVPIGRNVFHYYSGTFDGNGKTISNLYINNTTDNGCFSGLFGVAEDLSVIKNIKLVNVNVTCASTAGAVCGRSQGIINGVEVVSGSVTAEEDCVGGIAGSARIIKNCINRATIQANTTAGGICGLIMSGTIENCSNYGSVTECKEDNGGKVAGIIGNNTNYGPTIKNCVNYGVISTNSTSYSNGAPAAILSYSSFATIENCANFGDINTSNSNATNHAMMLGSGVYLAIKGAMVNSGKLYVNSIEQCNVRMCSGSIENNQYTYYDAPSDLTSGKYAFLLQRNCTVSTWGQNITTDPTDDYPVLGGLTVYAKEQKCDGSATANNPGFTNNINEVTSEPHSLIKTEAQEADGSTNGNTEYWKCSVCGLYFSDEAGTTEIEADSWVVRSNGRADSPVLIENDNDFTWLQTQATDANNSTNTYYVKLSNYYYFPSSESSKKLTFNYGTWNIDLNDYSIDLDGQTAVEIDGATVTFEDNGFGFINSLSYTSGSLVVKGGMIGDLKVNSTLEDNAITIRGGRFSGIDVKEVGNWSKINMVGVAFEDEDDSDENNIVTIPTNTTSICGSLKIVDIPTVGDNSFTVAAGDEGSYFKFIPTETNYYSFTFSGEKDVYLHHYYGYDPHFSYDLAGQNTYNTCAKLTAGTPYKIITYLDDNETDDQACTLSIATCGAPASGEAITANTTVYVADVPAYSQAVYSFTPTQSGVYSITSTEDVIIWPETPIAENEYKTLESPDGELFSFEGGTTYRIVVQNETCTTISGSTFILESITTPEISTLDPATITSLDEEEYMMYKFVAPKSKSYIFENDAWLYMCLYSDKFDYISENYELLSFNATEGSTYYIRIVNYMGGQITDATVTVTESNYDTDGKSLAEGENLVNINENHSVSYTFTPETTGKYRFYSVGENIDLSLIELSLNGTEIDRKGDNSEKYYQTENYADFCWTTTENLIAGKTYKVEIENNTDDAIDYKVYVEMMDPTIAEIGDANGNDYGAYANNSLNSTTITLYKGTEIGRSGLITDIAYNVAENVSDGFATNEVKIYMMMTEKTDLNAYEDINSADFKLVYSGNPTLGATKGWENLELDTPFNYDDNTKNLLIAVCRKSDSNESDLYYYDTYDDNGGDRMIYYSDNDYSTYGELSSLSSMISSDYICSNGSSADIRISFAKTYATYTIEDGIAYTGKNMEVSELTYNRTFSNTNWQALYVPFQMSYSDWSENFDVATIQNFHEYTDENGTVQKTVLEVRYVKSGKLKTNHPYLIRPKSDGDKTITLSNATLDKAASKSIVCQSVERKYTFTGTYQPMQNLKTNDYLFITGGSLMKATDDETTLKAQRWYLAIEDLESQVEDGSSSNAKAISIELIDDGDATGIEDIKVISTPLNGTSASVAGIYDLQGRRQQSLGKGVNIIRQAGGNVKKVLVK